MNDIFHYTFTHPPSVVGSFIVDWKTTSSSRLTRSENYF